MSKRIWADLMLLTVAVIWGSAFVAQRIIASAMGVFTFNGLRFLLGALTLLPFCIAVKSDGIEFPKHNRPSQAILGLALAGILLIGGSAFQQAGLSYTTAGNAGFVTGMYIVLIPIFLAILWRRQVSLIIWVAAFLALIGLFLLSAEGDLRINRGDAFILVGAVFWAFHVILIDWIVHRMNVFHFSAGQYLICGLISLAIGLLAEPQGLKPLYDYWWVVLYAGSISVGLGYTMQAFGQRVAPPADAAIILSLEAVFAALAGWLFLNESLKPVQIAGCLVMFIGMLLAQSEALFKKWRLGKV